MLCLPYLIDNSRVKSGSIHRNDAPEPDLSTHHMFECLGCLSKGELLNHAIDVVELGERNRFFAIQRMTRWPGVD